MWQICHHSAGDKKHAPCSLDESGLRDFEDFPQGARMICSML